jgi:hypothetical protein
MLGCGTHYRGSSGRGGGGRFGAGPIPAAAGEGDLDPQPVVDDLLKALRCSHSPRRHPPPCELLQRLLRPATTLAPACSISGERWCATMSVPSVKKQTSVQTFPHKRREEVINLGILTMFLSMETSRPPPPAPSQLQNRTSGPRFLQAIHQALCEEILDRESSTP